MSEDEIRALYTERAKCVIGIARAAKALLLTVGFATDASEPEWPVLYIDLPTGQVSWHLSRSDRELALDIGEYPGTYDGHSTELKYKRLMDWEPLL